jgi:hypothetical protein
LSDKKEALSFAFFLVDCNLLIKGCRREELLLLGGEETPSLEK